MAKKAKVIQQVDVVSKWEQESNAFMQYLKEIGKFEYYRQRISTARKKMYETGDGADFNQACYDLIKIRKQWEKS